MRYDELTNAELESMGEDEVRFYSILSIYEEGLYIAKRKDQQVHQQRNSFNEL